MEFLLNLYLIWVCAFLSVASLKAGLALLIMSDDSDWIVECWVLIKMALPILFLVDDRRLSNKLMCKLESWERNRDVQK